MEIKNPKLIWNIVMLIIIGIMIGAIALIYFEYTSAKKSCINSEGEFEFKLPLYYYCNTMPYLKYSDGWGYERTINFSAINFSI